MTTLALREFQFEGRRLTTLTVGGRPAWIAREIGSILGYAGDGKRFVNKLSVEWSDDFVPGVDHRLLTGDALAVLKTKVEGIAPNAKGLMVLFESGVHLALIRTQMPLGRKLRRFLVDEVMPTLVRTGEYSTAPKPENSGLPHVPLARELRLAARLDLDDRRFRSGSLLHTSDRLYQTGRIDGDTWASCQIAACEMALGNSLPALYVAFERGWMELTALAAQLGFTPERVKNAAQMLGLLDSRPGQSRPFPLKRNGTWEVGFRFSPKAVADIEAWLDATDLPPGGASALAA